MYLEGDRRSGVVRVKAGIKLIWMVKSWRGAEELKLHKSSWEKCLVLCTLMLLRGAACCPRKNWRI